MPQVTGEVTEIYLRDISSLGSEAPNHALN